MQIITTEYQMVNYMAMQGNKTTYTPDAGSYICDRACEALHIHVVSAYEAHAFRISS